jgi:hypothetical protein
MFSDNENGFYELGKECDEMLLKRSSDVPKL